MGWKTVVPIAAALAWAGPIVAIADEKPADVAAAVSAKNLTREQFQALAPDAVIEINGERITKSAFQERNAKALEETAKQLPEIRAQSLAAFEARRKALLDKRAALLAEANKSRGRGRQANRCRRCQTRTQLGSAQETGGRSVRKSHESNAY